MAVAVIRERVTSLLKRDKPEPVQVLQALCEAARAANDGIAKQPVETLSRADATTLVAAVCIAAQVVGIWCGDSRAYRIGRAIERLTRDHSWAERVISQGLMSPDEAARDPRAHMITRWLGPPARDDPGIETFSTHLADGDTVLCCSDGLYMYFNGPFGREDEMKGLLGSRGLEEGLRQLVSGAVARGGQDDITVSAMRLLAEPAAEAPQQ